MNTNKSGHWIVGGNQVKVYVVDNNLLDYSKQIDSAVLYGLLRRGDWIVYLSPGWMTGVMLLTNQEVHHYKLRDNELHKFHDYYCGQRHKELDWRKCGF